MDGKKNDKGGDIDSRLGLLLQEIENEETPQRLLELAIRLQTAMKEKRSMAESDDEN